MPHGRRCPSPHVVCCSQTVTDWKSGVRKNVCWIPGWDGVGLSATYYPLKPHAAESRPAPARAPEGKTPTREARCHPPDLRNPPTQGSIIWEPEYQNTMTRWPVALQFGRRRPRARGRPDLWPSLDIANIDPDIFFGSAILLEGEENTFLPCAGREQYASPCIPYNSSFPPSPSDNLTHDLLCGEVTATEQHATGGHRPKTSNPPNPHVKGLEEAGGMPSMMGNSPVILEDL
jgi:hypothetical protein